jgi:hypothetical protein
MTLGQYLAPCLVVAGAGLAGVRWPRVGAAIHALLAGALAWHFRGSFAAMPFLVVPLLLLGAGYLFGRAEPRRAAFAVVAGVPFVTAIASGAWPAWRVATRVDDGDRGVRRVTAEGVDLLWAPAGPGWPDDGVDWDEAVRRCALLAVDGTTLAPEPLGVWRLPTVEEVVRSQALHGANAGGRWDPAARRATYGRLPDKEPPLWDPRSKVIYWWTATEVDARTALIAVYNGGVWPRPKSARWGYLAFRAVRAPPP